ncbi:MULTISPECIES: enoyl-CoA hydratase/isomerase family protein [unclassified Sphingomonas]|uniref:enoyl-CoA hydratase/isomerase family protein n=1 Tax=unclassified Sphingomonas TaxID=196159 RepID=UPI0006F8C31B|nr:MULTISPECIES: enoyl-CoA hydratase-related protein [unclassified Sphingomonas]KQX18759.1 enoyl-CoA hydratase [Sphingomonas sp. Root1294]KQY71917.1 enoyl-CoA hydratase [Sphingomonas sp. Root50]KRB94818.1 enoyl-CoA hydratase [Sphingomonas sp. Root720]
MALFDDYKTILFGRRGRVLEVTLNRPEKLNATDAVLHAELARLFVDVSNDPDSDIVVLTGAGRAFSAGGDVAWMQEAIDEPERFEQTVREAKQIVFGLIDCEKPVIAKLNGHATGLGATIALFCDVIFAAEHARIGDPHVSIGFVAGDGGAVIWPQLIGYARAKEYLLTGDLMTATQAAQMGLINHVVPADQLDERVDAFADRLANGATKAIRWTKMSVNIGLRDLATSIMDASLAYEALSNMTPDHAEAVKAFSEKRPPVFARSKGIA